MSKFVDFCCVELAVAYPEKKTYQKTTVPEGKSVECCHSTLEKGHEY